MKKLSKLSLKFWFTLGIIIRLLLMPITAHSDIWALNFGRYFFVEKGVFNIYGYLYNLPFTHPLVQNYGTNFFTYPPLAYFALGIFGFLLKPFYNSTFTLWLMNNFSKVYQNPEVFKTLFLLKLPYLFFDIGMAFLLRELFTKEKDKKRAFIFWMLNPLALYTSFMIGQFDIIPVFFIALSLYFLKLKKPKLAVISLGIGGSFKMFPLLFLPFLVFSLTKNFKERIKLGVIGFAPYFLTIAPFLKSAAFRGVALFSPQSQKMLFMILPLSGAEGVYIFVLAYFFLFWLSFYLSPKKEEVWRYFLMVMLCLFSVTHYHPQWFLWLTPLIFIEMIKNKFKYLWLDLTFFLSWLGITLLFEPSLNFALFAPLRPALSEMTPISEIINRFYNVFQLKSLIRSLFAATAVLLVYLNFRDERTKEIS